MSSAVFMAIRVSSDWEPVFITAAFLLCVALAARFANRGANSHITATDPSEPMPPPPRSPVSGKLRRLRWFYGRRAAESPDLKAAQAGDAAAQVRLALNYLNNYRLPSDPLTAVAWLRLAAAQGNHDAYFELGRLYARGIAVSKNPSEAIRWYRLAAASPDPGMVLPQFHLGCMHASGDGVVKNTEEAARWYNIAAVRGHPRAMLFLALAYLHGDGVPEDPASALHWIQLAAAKGDSTARFHLGHLYAQGRAVPRDLVAAGHWFRLAAEDLTEPLSVLPQYHLGRMYATGDGVPKDSAEAIKYYRIAAERGYPPAQGELGLSYLRGEGSVQNSVEALAWLTLATESSRREPYRQHHQALAAGLPPTALKQASARARELARTVYRNRRGAPIPPVWAERSAEPTSNPHSPSPHPNERCETHW